MPSLEVRRFRRADREQLTGLVNAHVAAVVPGISVSVNAVLNQLEREPAEFVVDPWVRERVTLVAEHGGRVVAAAHLLRYGADQDVGEHYRDAGELRWFLFWPETPFWRSGSETARDALLDACLEIFAGWGVSREYADGALPAPGVYGVPEQWAHIRAAYERAGFVQRGRTEIVYVAVVDELPRAHEAPAPDLRVRRSVGINGTRLSALVGDEVAGYIEIDVLEDSGRLPRHAGWADVGNLEVGEAYRRRGIGTWLVGRAADWLGLARIDRLLAYAWPEEECKTAFLERAGFRELTRTGRGWVRDS